MDAFRGQEEERRRVKRGEERNMKITDPVCKMTIDEGEAVATSMYNGTKYYFCSTACKQKFDSAPESYVAEERRPDVGQGAVQYTCPMHPEVRQQFPGSCPKCGMALEPATPVVARRKTEWTCPMHPEVVRESPGSCPICGMSLEPRSVTPDDEENP